MKNKRLAIFLGIFIFLAVIVILTSTVFTLHAVEIEFVGDVGEFAEQTTQIKESGEFKYGESIFLASKKTYTARIEKATPYLRVINIETVFPNKLIVHMAKREECFVIKMSNNKYAVTDEQMKVLNIIDIYQNNATNPIEIKNTSLSEQSVTAGDFFYLEDNYIPQIFRSFREWNLDYGELKSKITSIELDYEKMDRLLVNMRSGVQIIIENSKSQLSDKLNLAFSFYDTKTDKNGNPVDYTNSGIILITETKDKIYGLYKPVD